MRNPNGYMIVLATLLLTVLGFVFLSAPNSLLRPVNPTIQALRSHDDVVRSEHNDHDDQVAEDMFNAPDLITRPVLYDRIPDDIAAPVSPAGRLLIGVLTDPSSLDTIAQAVHDTWASDIESSRINVIFFVGSCAINISTNFNGRLVCLNTPDTYPPQRKVFLLWRYMYTHMAHRYQWFMKLDHDAYINVDRMSAMVALISTDLDLASHATYMGVPAAGRKEERQQLGLDGHKYCLGLGYIVNAPILETLTRYGDDCLADVRSNHSDTEIGRCIFGHMPGTECQDLPSSFQFKQVYYQQDDTKVYPMKLFKSGQMRLEFFQQPKAVHFSSVVVHPLKRAEDFVRFHHQQRTYLRPVQPPINSHDSDPASYRSAIGELRATCVHNAVLQKQLYRYRLAECPAVVADVPASELLPPSRAFVLTADPSQSRYQDLVMSLKDHGITAEPVHLTGNAAAYNRALANLFAQARMRGDQHVLVLEDSVLLRCDFRKHLTALLRSRRCGQHLFTAERGGVLVLGADPVSMDELALIEADQKDAYAVKDSTANDAMCYNVLSGTKGAFGAIYHRATFDEVVANLQRFHDQSSSAAPLEGMYQHLSAQGFVVRAAFPNALLREATLVDLDDREIRVRMRWTEGDFCLHKGEVYQPDLSR